MNASRLRLAFCAGALLALPTASAAISPQQLGRLPMVVEGVGPGGRMVTLERVGSYLAALKRAGHSCRLSTYAYGGEIVCHTRAGKHVLIDLQGVPTRYPEFANVGSLRPDGINSPSLPSAEMPGFLAGLKSRK